MKIFNFLFYFLTTFDDRETKEFVGCQWDVLKLSYCLSQCNGWIALPD